MVEKYTLSEIERKLNREEFPFDGVTELGTTSFTFKSPSPFVGAAIHAGSIIRESLIEALAVSDSNRLREEDPGTEKFIEKLPISFTAIDSRFEYDLNRSIEKAIPLTPEMAWGLQVWNRDLTRKEIAISLDKYREFHYLMDITFDYLVERGCKVYLFDIHSYCYQRESQLPWYKDQKPVINLGTEPISRKKFHAEISFLLERFNDMTVSGRKISVGENEVFKGGYLARRLCARHPENLAVFAIEFKKVFMDEWSGKFYQDEYSELVNQFELLMEEFIGIFKTT